MVFSVIFEVQPVKAYWDTYLSTAKTLRPLSEGIPGYISNIRYRSLTRDGWILSLSSWSSEKALVRWRTLKEHHDVQELGRRKLLEDYHLRVGQNLHDSAPEQGPGDEKTSQERVDETEIGEGAIAIMIEAKFDPELVKGRTARENARAIGLDVPAGDGKQQLSEPSIAPSDLVAWDIFEAILEPGTVLLLMTCKNDAAALAVEEAQHKQGHGKTEGQQSEARVRRVRIIRDYGKYDRREAPQYYPDADGRETVH